VTGQTEPGSNDGTPEALERQGAVAFPVPDGPDLGAAWHYGDPLREQRRLDAGEGFVDHSHRPVVRVSGPDRLSWLHSITSQHLTELTPGTWTQALVLSPHGHVEHHLTLVDDGEAVWAHVEPGTLDGLLQYLRMMTFWSDVEISDAGAERAAVWLPGPHGMDGADRWELVPRDTLASWSAQHGPPAGLWAYEALRVAAGRPRLGLETDHRTIPHEVGWIGPAVHLDKGCYRGQETVARVQNLGRPPRRLVRLHLDGSEQTLPRHGAAVTWNERPAGFVGTAVHHYELGPVALAVVKRNTPDDAVLLVDVVDEAPVSAHLDALVRA
jgi:folate-binding protein YgfZ